MIKLIHTADVHLDTPFTGAGFSLEQARQRRRDLVNNFESICNLVTGENAQMFLIAGDLFDEEYLKPATLKTVIDLLASLDPVPVVISPGNHDHYHMASPYRIETWPDNVHIFNSIEPAKFSFNDLDLSVHGCAFTAPHVKQAVWDRFRIDHTRSLPVNILLTHGAHYEGEAGQAANYLPISTEQVMAIGAQYTALGHYHRGYNVVEDKFTGSVRAAYPGSPEPMRWGAEPGAGPLVVTIDPEEKKTEVRRAATAIRHYKDVTLEAGNLITDRDFRSRLLELSVEEEWDENTILRVTITGRHNPDIPIDPAGIETTELPVFSFRVIDETTPDFDLETIAGERSVRGLAVKELQNLAEEGDEREREVARQALALMLTAFEGKNPEDIPL